jgi:sulfoxide reductase heme-binding subunit YedZ
MNALLASAGPSAYWYLTRSTGAVALLLLTFAIALGVIDVRRLSSPRWPRFLVDSLHRNVSLLAMVFLVLHILTTVADSYVSTGIISAVVPFTSSYKDVAVTVGAVGFDLILAVWVSSLLKVRIKNQSWRFIHWFSWLAFTAAIVHSFLIGTDTRRGAGLILVGLCALSVIVAALWRYVARPTRAAGRTALSPLASHEPASREADATSRATR